MGSEAHDGAEPFFRGVAISTFQNSGDPNSQWAAFEKRKKFWFWPTTYKGQQSGSSCGFWDHYEKDILLAKQVGANAFRFSLEWSRVMPQQGVIDKAAIQRFHDIFDCIKRNGLEPFPTLHHFVHPQWFEELGGFTKQCNVKLFVDWCKLAFEEYGSKARYWATINESNITSMCGYVMAMFPPARMLDLRAGALNVLHLLQGHAAVYRLIKERLPGGKDVQVGIVHNVFWLAPYGEGPLYTHVRWLCAFGNHTGGTPQIVEFLRTGHFRWTMPPGWGPTIEYQDPLGPPGLDYIGLNNYTRGVLDWRTRPTTRDPDEVMADFNWPICPSALYASIACVAKLGVPIYITENGCPDHLDDARRPMWIDGYLGAVVQALRDGFDIRGFFYWTLMDNFEWAEAFNQKFGLYRWDRERPDERHLREGSKKLISWYRRLPGLVAQIRKEVEARRAAAKGHLRLPEVTYTWYGAFLLDGKPADQVVRFPASGWRPEQETEAMALEATPEESDGRVRRTVPHGKPGAALQLNPTG